MNLLSNIAQSVRTYKYLADDQLAVIPPSILEGLEEEMVVLGTFPPWLNAGVSALRIIGAWAEENIYERRKKLFARSLRFGNDIFDAALTQKRRDQAVEKIAGRLEQASNMRILLWVTLQLRQSDLLHKKALEERDNWEKSPFIQ